MFVDVRGNTVDQLLEFFELNHVSEFLSKEQRMEAYKKIVKGPIVSVIFEMMKRDFTKRN